MIGIANAFSGGIFLSISLLHLLSESSEIFSEHMHTPENEMEESEEGHHEHFPFSYFLAFCGYTLILWIEKVIFEQHSHKEHGNDHKHSLKRPKNCEDVELGLRPNDEPKHFNINNNFNINLHNNCETIDEYESIRMKSSKLLPSQSANLLQNFGKDSIRKKSQKYATQKVFLLNNIFRK
jgi:zinc transporter ZupT